MPSGSYSIFDGYNLTLYRADGSIVGSWAAISGASGHQKPSEQNLKDVGPIPEGSYSFAVNDIQLLNSVNQLAGVVGRGAWPGSMASWGTERAFLAPDASTDVQLRDNFSIHGGFRPGSRGCIDLGPNEAAYFAAVRNLGDPSHSVIIQYDQHLETQNHPLASQTWFDGISDYIVRPIPGILDTWFPAGSQLNKNETSGSIIYPDGSVDNIEINDTQTRIVSTDIGGQVIAVATLDNSGTNITISDFASAYSWSEKSIVFGPGGKLDVIKTSNDDSSKTTLDYDQDANKVWSQQTTNTDTNNQITSVATLNDDGSKANLSVTGSGATKDVAFDATKAGETTPSFAAHFTETGTAVALDSVTVGGTSLTAAQRDFAERALMLSGVVAGALLLPGSANGGEAGGGGVAQIAITDWSVANGTVTINADLPAGAHETLTLGATSSGTITAGGTTIAFNPATLTSFGFDANGYLALSVANADGSTSRTQFDGNGSEAWAAMTTVLAANGTIVTQDALADDGTRSVYSADVANAANWAWSIERYDAAGRHVAGSGGYDGDPPASWTNAYDVLNTQPWQQLTTGTAAGGGTAFTVTLADDNTRAIVNFDPDGTQPWTQVTSDFDALGRVTRDDIQNDDGTVRTTDYDAANLASWASDTVIRDAGGSILTDELVNDNGTRVKNFFDPHDNQWWYSYTDSYDGSGGITAQTGTGNDGATWSSVYDASHSLVSTDWHGAGGSHWANYYDPHGTHAWSSYTEQYDAGGGVIAQTGTQDDLTTWSSGFDASHSLVSVDWHGADGSHWRDYFDPHNALPWTTITDRFDAAGNLIAENGHGDDNTQWASAADPSNTQPWSSYTSYYDAAARFTSQLGHWDDNTYWMRFDDPANSASWRTFTDTYDTSGRRTTETGVRDDNTGWVYSFDVANRATWKTMYYQYDGGGTTTGVSTERDNGSIVAVAFNGGGNGAGSAVLTLNLGDGAQLLEAIGSVVSAIVTFLSAFADALATFLGSLGDLFSYSFPVILDLDGNGVDVTPLSASHASFDMNHDGVREHTAWAGSGDGLLAIDLAANGAAGPDGAIDQSREILFTQWAPNAASDMAALREVFDTNRDGALDAGDARWTEFRVWHDANGDGLSAPAELTTLDALGIASIDLHPSGPSVDFPDGSAVTGLAPYTRTDGSHGLAGDVALAFDPFTPPARQQGTIAEHGWLA
jgi:hypothetical protein